MAALTAATAAVLALLDGANAQPPLELSNDAVRVTFSAQTGELLSLVNRHAAGKREDDYLKVAVAPASSSTGMYCSQGEHGWYIQTGGDPAVETGWRGPPYDRCCRVKDNSGLSCHWFRGRSECESALPGWQDLCLSCAVSDQPLGCPTFASDSPLSIGGHGLFLAWVDAPPPVIAENPGWAGGTPAPIDGLPSVPTPLLSAIGPSKCNLTSHATSAIPGGGTELTMTLSHAPTALRFHITAALAAGDAQALNLSLQVERDVGQYNGQVPPSNITVAFPYISGIAIGGNGSGNAGINHFGTGLCTDGQLAAWNASGGLYGWHTSHVWTTVWEPSSGDGLAMIVKDTGILNDTAKQRVIMRFPADAASPSPSAVGVFALAYPATPLGEQGERVEPNAPVQLFVHGGGWRVAAKKYGSWLRSIGITDRSTPSWLDRVMSYGSDWVPDKAKVAANKLSKQGLTSFEDLYETYYATNTIDMIEFAMWWEGVSCTPSWACGYGAFGADGIFLPRKDLGGVAALRSGVEKIHKMGRRIQLYVSADIVQMNSSLFNASWPWQKWADWPSEAGPADPQENYNASTLCHAFAAWQQQVALFTARAIEETGVDGVRLDGLGGQYAPCYNPAHRHTSPFENQGTAANRQMAGLTRRAMDAVPGGTQAILSSEGYQDVFHPHIGLSLVMFYPGKDVDAMRVALPEYRGAAYAPDAGDIETSLNGWMASGGNHALRSTWPYGSTCGAPQLPGFPGQPCNYPSDGGRITRWSELRPTLIDALLRGQLSATDPGAPADAEFVSRLYIAETHLLLLSARWNGSTPATATTVVLPSDDVTAGVLRDVEHAVEIDAYTLATTTPVVTRPGADVLVRVSGGFSAVLLPKPDCPALLVLSPAVVPAIAASGTNSTTVALSLHAPWQRRKAAAAAAAAAAAITVQVSAPGLGLSASSITLPGKLSLWAKNSSRMDSAAFFMLTIEGAGVLPTRRWVKAVPGDGRADQVVYA